MFNIQHRTGFIELINKILFLNSHIFSSVITELKMEIMRPPAQFDLEVDYNSTPGSRFVILQYDTI